MIELQSHLQTCNYFKQVVSPDTNKYYSAVYSFINNNNE